MNYKKSFYDELKENFIPILRQSGFKGSGQNYRRVNGEAIYAINIQNNKYGGSCCINIGVHFTFLPVVWDSKKMPDVKSIKEVDCEFRYRLSPKNKPDYWWPFKGEGLFGNPSKSVEHLCKTFNDSVVEFLDQYRDLENVTSKFPISSLESGEFVDVLGGVVAVRGALTMARIYQHTGQLDLQKQYAKVGLSILGKANALKAELECLAK